MKLQATSPHKYLKVGTKKRGSQVELDSILRLEGVVNYTYLYTADRKFVLSKTLKSLETTLNRNQFIRIHKSHIVNKDHIKSSHFAGTTGRILLDNGLEVDVSRRRKKDVQRFLAS